MHLLLCAVLVVITVRIARLAPVIVRPRSICCKGVCAPVISDPFSNLSTMTVGSFNWMCCSRNRGKRERRYKRGCKQRFFCLFFHNDPFMKNSSALKNNYNSASPSLTRPATIT